MYYLTIDNDTEKEYAEELWDKLLAARDSVPGWMGDSVNLDEIIEVVANAIDDYEEKNA